MPLFSPRPAEAGPAGAAAAAGGVEEVEGILDVVSMVRFWRKCKTQSNSQERVQRRREMVWKKKGKSSVSKRGEQGCLYRSLVNYKKQNKKGGNGDPAIRLGPVEWIHVTSMGRPDTGTIYGELVQPITDRLCQSRV